MLRSSAALQICPTREEKVSRTTSNRASQSWAEWIRGSAAGIISRGMFSRFSKDLYFSNRAIL